MTVTLDLEAEIDGQGRSLRPVQISHWLSGVLSAPLEVTGMRRCGLELAPGGARTQGCNGSSANV